MNANILTDANFPHGTPQGYPRGCHGSHCPSEIPCRDVHTRYNGDYAFRRQYDTGMTALDIITIEREQSRTSSTSTTRETGRSNNALIPRHLLRQLLNEGLTDAQIGARLGLTRRQVTGPRNNTGWARNPDANRRSTTPAPATTGAVS